MSRKNNQKKEGYKVKIFTVPIKLEEIQDNTTLYSNTLPRASKKEILNKAFKLHEQGKILEAAKN